MNDLVKRTAIAVFFAALSCVANAADPRCNAPPSGGTVNGYKAFVKNFGSVVPPVKILGSVCNAKFGGDRTGLYNLGFTDADIDSKDTATLAADVVMAMKDLVDKVK